MEKVGMTPKYKRIPQTVEEYKYLLDLYDDGFHKMLQEISKLKHKVNTLSQKLGKRVE